MKRPLVWAAWIWIAGSGAAIAAGPLPGYVIYALLGFAALLAAFIWLFELPGRKASLCALLLCAAFCRYEWEERHNATMLTPPGTALADADGAEVFVRGMIDSPVEIDGDRVSFTLRADKVVSSAWSGKYTAKGGRGERVQISVRLLQQREQIAAAGWQRGDQAAFAGTLRLPSEARNFGGFDYREYLRLQHIHWLISVKGTDEVRIQPPNRLTLTHVLRWNDRLRSLLGAKLDTLFPGDQGGYMKSLLLGIREDLNPEQFKQFSELGLTHLLAISGMHVAVFVGVLMWLMRRIGLAKETNMLICISLIPGYVLLTGSSPSIVRAGLMAMIGLQLARRNRLKDGQQIIGAAALAMLLWNPYILLDVGFQLSFLVTWGLIVGVPKIAPLFRAKPAWLNGALAVSVTAQLVSFPVTVYYFNQFSLLSLPANLLLVPLIGTIVTPLGSIALIVSLAVPLPGRWLAQLTIWLNDAGFWIIGLMNRWSGGLRLIWPKPPLWWIVAVYAAGALLIWVCWKRKRDLQERKGGVWLRAEPGGIHAVWRTVRLPFAAGTLAILLLYGYNLEKWNDRSAGTVCFLDVGQGDAALIRTPGNRYVLSDGGGTMTLRKAGEEWKERRDPYEVGKKLLVPLLKQRGVQRLYAVIVSHEDTDHIGGLLAVLENIPVDRILFNGTIKHSDTAERLFHAALAKRIPLIVAQQGQTLRLDRDTVLSVLSPASAASSGRLTVAEEQNEHMLVFHLNMLGFTFLFSGDVTAEGERDILEQSRANAAFAALNTSITTAAKPLDVLKVAHHGSKTSSSDEWLSRWQPRLAVISVGLNNIYRHPSPEVVERLEAHGADVLRTDLNGEVRIRVTGQKLAVETKLKPTLAP